MNWSEIFEKRYKIHEKWPKVWDLPLFRKRQTLIETHFAGCHKILDFGADKREWETRLKKSNPSLQYFSCDINDAQAHDWNSPDDITEKFQGILMLEVIEHLEIEKGIKLLEKFYGLLESGGTLILSTPNIWHPPQYMRDATHVQPWAYDELGGVLLKTGFEVKGIWRLWNSHLLDRITRCLFGQWIHRYIGIDFSKTIMIVAQKP